MNNIIIKQVIKYTGITLSVVFVLFALNYTIAATPTGADWFEMNINPFTGFDNTGDGGTGLGADLNYFYVGQSATQTIKLNSSGTDAANIWIDYDNTKMNIPSVLVGSYFPTWAGQSISSGRIKSTGFNISDVSSGLGIFGTFTINFVAPNEFAYDITNPEILDINIGAVGDTTESNISYGGLDILDSAEDFQLHIWADTVKPFAENVSPSNLAIGVAVDSNFSFDLRDTLNGEGDNTGVGTGVNTLTGSIIGTPASINYFSDASYSCSGIWNYNLCSVTVDPSGANMPTSISGDTRNWQYNTTYTMTISNYRDLASNTQDQLGDTNGPNIMNDKVYTFSTESDLVSPQVTSESPIRGNTGASVSADVIVILQDRKSYPNGTSGVGIDSSTCRFNISSTSLPVITFQQGDATVTTTAVDYGYQFTINPVTNFAENETVYVSAFGCTDTANNIMVTDNWSFSTSDNQAPYIDQIFPDDDANIDANGTISFHIKDDGSGVDLSNVIIYVNGQYYTNNGGAVNVTTVGTKITSATSFNFNGSNYIGDTTSVIGAVNDYNITIDLQSSFVSGEAIPVIIYAKDNNGNIMQRNVFALVSGGGVCTTGSSFCGTNTSWNGNQCISSLVSGGGGGTSVTLQIYDEKAVQVDEKSILITWRTNKASNSWVVYDEIKPKDYGNSPNFSYKYITEQKNDNSLLHFALITNLKPQRVYYFKSISSTSGSEFALSNDLVMTPKFKTETKEVENIIVERIETNGETKIIYKDKNTGEIIDTQKVETKDRLKINMIKNKSININNDIVFIPQSVKYIEFEGGYKANSELIINFY